MCVWFSAWEVVRGGDFLLALPISDHTQAHSPSPPWRRSQEQDSALERRGPVLPVMFLKERLMRRFLGASGAERHGLAAEGGVGWKLTNTQGGKPGSGGGCCPSRPLPTSAPRVQTHRPVGWPSLYTCAHTHTHTHHCPQGLSHPSTLTGDIELNGSLHGHLKSFEIHPIGEVSAVVLGPWGGGELQGMESPGCSSSGTISAFSSPGPGSSVREEVPRMWERKEEAPAGSRESSR